MKARRVLTSTATPTRNAFLETRFRGAYSSGCALWRQRAELQASIAIVHGGRFAAQLANPRNPGCLKNNVRSVASPAHTRITCFVASRTTHVCRCASERDRAVNDD